ncbi:MAG: DUF3352 domain-containing protein [Chloroflexi bacterium]|nr:DUF3352 domain-containing protein [Chloroflexota bacterium]
MTHLIAIVVAVLAIAFPAATAEPADGIFQLAQYMPADADVFVAFRADDAYLDTLDSVLAGANTLAADLGSPGVNLNARAMIANALQVERSNLDAFLAWAGDAIGIAAVAEGDGTPIWLAAIPHANRQAADVFLRTQGFVDGGTYGTYSAYGRDGISQVVLLEDTVAFVIPGPEFAPDVASGEYGRLSNDPGYVAAVRALPVESYNAAAYLSRTFAAAQLGLSMDTQNGVIVGLTLADAGGIALIADVVQMPGSTPVTQPLSINPEFRRFVPADATAVVHGAELGGLINTAIDALEANGIPNMRANTQALLRGAGIDLTAMLNWMKGDFALFARIDLQGLYRYAVGTTSDPETLQDLFDIGLVVEAVNPAGAAETARGLASVLRALGATERADVTTETVGGVELTVLRIDTLEAFAVRVPLAIAVGANDEVFVLGTYNAVTSILSGEPGIDSAASYGDSTALWLDQPTSVWFVDSDVLAGAVGALVALGPAVEPAYLDIIAVLDENAPPPEPILPAPAAIDGIISNLGEFARYATITTNVDDDGVQRLRAAITLGASSR